MGRPDRTAGRCGIVSLVMLLLASPHAGLAQQANQSPLSLQADSALRIGNFGHAAELLEQRARAGDLEAQYQLASLYRSGRGVIQDDAAAFFWMKSAAESGHAKAQFNLAKIYLAGRGVAVDAQQA
jgi:TPR repeat protein